MGRLNSLKDGNAASDGRPIPPTGGNNPVPGELLIPLN